MGKRTMELVDFMTHLGGLPSGSPLLLFSLLGYWFPYKNSLNPKKGLGSKVLGFRATKAGVPLDAACLHRRQRRRGWEAPGAAAGLPPRRARAARSGGLRNSGVPFWGTLF